MSNEFKSLTKEEKTILAKFANIGKVPDGSFVLISKNQLKVVHSTSVIQAIYKFDEDKFDVEEPFNIFDASILASLLDACDKYKFKIVNNKFKLALYTENDKYLGCTEGELVPYGEVTNASDMDKLIDPITGESTVHRIIRSDIGIHEAFGRIEASKITSGLFSNIDFTKLQMYMKKLKGDYFTISPSREENKLDVTIKRNLTNISHTFQIEVDYVNFPEDRSELMFRFPLDYITPSEDGYYMTINDTGMHLKSERMQYLITVVTKTYEDELKDVLRQTEQDTKDELDDIVDID